MPFKRTLLFAPGNHARPCHGYVRVHAMGTPLCFRDLCEVVGKDVDGVLLPKSVPPRRRCGCSRDPARWTGNRLPDRLSGRASAPGGQG